MTQALTTNFQRAQKFWFLVLISGVLHLVVGKLYLTTEMIHYLWLSKVFIGATIAKGIFEIGLYGIFQGRLDFIAFPAPLFDIALGVFIMVAPIIPLFFLPFYIAVGLGLRGLILLLQFRVYRKKQVEGLSFLRAVGWILILFSILMFILAVVDPINIWPAGLTILAAGVSYIVLAIRLKTGKQAPNPQ